MKRIFFLIITFMQISVLSFPALILAQEPKNEYIVFKGGIYSPEHDDVKNFSNTGINLELAYGIWTSKYLGAELGIGYFNTQSNKGVTTNAKARFIDIFYNGKVRYPAGNGEIYGGAGMGVFFGKYIAKDAGISNLETNLGFQVLAGGKMDVRQDYFVGVEGKYLWTKLDEIDLHFDGFTVSAIVGTRF